MEWKVRSMVSSNNKLDLFEDFDPASLKEMREREQQLDGGLIPCSFEKYLEFLETMRPSREQLLGVEGTGVAFSLE
jgi:hypothetical protein